MPSKKPFYKPGDGYEWEKTVKHFLKGLVLTLTGTGLTYTINYVQIAEVPPEYAVYTGFIIAVLIGFSNMVKHWSDEYQEEPLP